MTKDEALSMALKALEWFTAAEQGDEPPINKAITAIKAALAQPDPYKQGYADAMNWKVQNHLEHLPVAQKLSKWKLVPRDPTDEMLKAMDDCSMEGYDERLYAGHAASVYMAAVDVAPTPPHQPVSNTDELAQPEQNPTVKQSLMVQLEQEPMLWVNPNLDYVSTDKKVAEKHGLYIPLYTVPPQRTWAGLTDEEVNKLVDDEDWYNDPHEFAKAVEAKLKEKNQ